MEDPETIVYLKVVNTGQHTKYDVFGKCQKFLQENSSG